MHIEEMRRDSSKPQKIYILTHMSDIWTVYINGVEIIVETPSIEYMAKFIKVNFADKDVYINDVALGTWLREIGCKYKYMSYDTIKIEKEPKERSFLF